MAAESVTRNSKTAASRPAAAEKITVVMNVRSGGGESDAVPQQVREILRAAGRDHEVLVNDDIEVLRRAVARAVARRAPAVVAGGGDGTVRTVAEQLAGTGIPLGVLPMGTLNHFAKDLHLPLDPAAAMEVILQGRTTRVDVGEVNGCIFINNSSLGLYPHMVELRRQHPARGARKWAIAAWAMLKELRRNRRVSVELEVEGEAVTRHTPLLMVANNEYKLTGFDATARESLASGQLAVYIVKPGTTWRFAKLVWQILWGRAHRGDHMEVFKVRSVTVNVRRTTVAVACDGELNRLDSPLEYGIRPGALTVLVP